ncbi:MAG: cation diffusion facilitator family transporter, partial [Candidatus Bipolaricaulia bacterium]
MSELAEDSELRNMKWAVALYTLVFLMKLVGFFFTGVMVLLADALHSLSDVIIYAFLLVAAIWSEKGADEAYRLGYGRAQNAAALIAGTLFISFTSYKLYEEAVPKLLNPGAVTAHNFNLALGVIGVTMVLLAIPLIQLWRQETRGAAARAQALEIINDEFSSLAAIIGTLFLMWNVPIIDPIATMVVATLIGINGLRLV